MYIENDSRTYINSNYGNPTLTILGDFGTFDGSCPVTEIGFRSFDFTPTYVYADFDGSCPVTETGFRDFATAP